MTFKETAPEWAAYRKMRKSQIKKWGVEDNILQAVAHALGHDYIELVDYAEVGNCYKVLAEDRYQHEMFICLMDKDRFVIIKEADSLKSPEEGRRIYDGITEADCGLGGVLKSVRKGFGSPMHEAFVGHAKFNGGHDFDYGSDYVECELSDDYFFDAKFDGVKLRMDYDEGAGTFTLSAERNGTKAAAPEMKLTDPENIGENIEGLLSYCHFNHVF